MIFRNLIPPFFKRELKEEDVLYASETVYKFDQQTLRFMYNTGSFMDCHGVRFGAVKNSDGMFKLLRHGKKEEEEVDNCCSPGTGVVKCGALIKKILVDCGAKNVSVDHDNYTLDRDGVLMQTSSPYGVENDSIKELLRSKCAEKLVLHNKGGPFEIYHLDSDGDVVSGEPKRNPAWSGCSEEIYTVFEAFQASHIEVYREDGPRETFEMTVDGAVIHTVH